GAGHRPQNMDPWPDICAIRRDPRAGPRPSRHKAGESQQPIPQARKLSPFAHTTVVTGVNRKTVPTPIRSEWQARSRDRNNFRTDADISASDLKVEAES